MNMSDPTDLPTAKTQTDPPIWAILGSRFGDNQQVLALASALGLPYRETWLRFNRGYSLPNWLLGATCATVKRGSRDQLGPPWPKLVIASGRRSVPVAKWIKQQSNGATKIVQIGRPRAPLQQFDLVVTTSQYGLPRLNNVLSLSLPLARIARQDQEEINLWSGTFAELPRPWTGVLVGGSTWPFLVNERAATKLSDDIQNLARRCGGSFLVTTSPRTGQAVAPVLREQLQIPHHVHQWQPESANPYRSILALADQLVVTSDSVSMIADACRTDKPVAIWRAPTRRDPFSRVGLMLGRHANSDNAAGRLISYLGVRGIMTPPRFVDRISDNLVASGRVNWLTANDDITDPNSLVPADDGLPQAVARVRAVLDQ